MSETIITPQLEEQKQYTDVQTNSIKREDDIKNLMTLDQAASHCGMSKHTVRNWTQKNKLRSYKKKGKFGLQSFVHVHDLNEFMKAYEEEEASRTNLYNPDIAPAPHRVAQPSIPQPTHSIPEHENITNSNIVDKHLEMLKEQMQYKDKELDTKNQQIKDLMQQNADLAEQLNKSRNESNIIIKGMNENIMPLLETQTKMLQDNRVEISEAEEKHAKEIKEISEKLTELSKPKKFLGLF